MSVTQPASTAPAVDELATSAESVRTRRARPPLSRTVRRTVERLLVFILGDRWMPRMGVALALLIVLIGLVTIIGVTLGPITMLVVLATTAIMRLLCDDRSCVTRS